MIFIFDKDRADHPDTGPIHHTITTDRVYAIDPGLQGTGFAEFYKGELQGVAVLKVPSRYAKAPWSVRADYLAAEVTELVDVVPGDRGSVPVVLCEMPEFQAGAGRSMGWKTGDLQRLAYLVGLFSAAVAPAQFIPVGVARWKGQLPKDVVIERLTRNVGATKCRKLGIESHAWDAVGIGMWGLGKF